MSIIIRTIEAGPGDVQAAREYLAEIETLLTRTDLSLTERRKLRELRIKWRARVEGRDPRYLVVGNRAGRLTPEQEIEIKAQKAAHKAVRAAQKAAKKGKR